MDITQGAFWIALLQIVWIDILLSGDNALVIAMAARALPAKDQKKAIVFGAGAAIVLRILLTLLAAQLLMFPYLKVVGSILLLYIGVHLLFTDEGKDDQHEAKTTLGAAIGSILVADVVMSLDNVIAVAAAAKDHFGLLIFGLVLSIPLMIWGSSLLLRLIERFPIIVWFGAALLGFIAGEMFVKDVVIHPWAMQVAESWGITYSIFSKITGAIGAIIVLLVGKIWLSLKAKKTTA
ncbi:TerC family protein [Brackiella oedipodis]|uniref:TerC family protein n=1 Tax=Brackiella oedipodis TaxID=124225 RepID=UPI00048F0B9E|nr:TerC family protein [Brackiella oedipodis]